MQKNVPFTSKCPFSIWNEKWDEPQQCVDSCCPSPILFCILRGLRFKSAEHANADVNSKKILAYVGHLLNMHLSVTPMIIAQSVNYYYSTITFMHIVTHIVE